MMLLEDSDGNAMVGARTAAIYVFTTFLGRNYFNLLIYRSEKPC